MNNNEANNHTTQVLPGAVVRAMNSPSANEMGKAKHSTPSTTSKLFHSNTRSLGLAMSHANNTHPALAIKLRLRLRYIK
jgi:hypothetical protein